MVKYAELRMVQEIDAAKERGEVARNGQHGEAVQTSDSLGLDRRRVAEWRELRDAGGEKVVEAAIEQPLKHPSSAPYSKCAGGLASALPSRTDARGILETRLKEVAGPNCRTVAGNGRREGTMAATYVADRYLRFAAQGNRSGRRS